MQIDLASFETLAHWSPQMTADELVQHINAKGRVSIDAIPSAASARDLVLEATYADPNGEVQTLRSTLPLWPAGVIAGFAETGRDARSAIIERKGHG